MSLKLGDIAPDFSAETTQGPIRFHEWIGDGWAILFSHPKDFTPVCTTELGYMAGLKPEFEKRNCKILGLSVDPLDDHQRWAKDIAEPYWQKYFDLMPIHEKMRTKDAPTTHGYLRVVLINVHDELSKRIDVASVVRALEATGGEVSLPPRQQTPP